MLKRNDPEGQLHNVRERRQQLEDRLTELKNEEASAQDKLAETHRQAVEAEKQNEQISKRIYSRSENNLNEIRQRRERVQEALSIVHAEEKQAREKVKDLQRKRFNREMREAVKELYTALMEASEKNERVLRLYQQACDELPKHHELVPAHLPELVQTGRQNSKLIHWLNSVFPQYQTGQDAQETPEGVEDYDREDVGREAA